MNRAIRRVALVLGLVFAALFAQLNYVQIARSKALSEHSANRRLLVEEYDTQRGEIIAGNVVIAESVPTDDRLKFLRRYPQKELYGYISGYYSFIFGRYGLESTFNGYLSGAEPASERDFLDDLLGRERKGNTILLTLDHKLQKIAAEKLGDQRGAVAAIDPRTGAVKALYAYPGFDPNPLSTHDNAQIQSAWQALNDDPLKPLLSRATQQRYPPGSTFKILTAAAALELGKIKSTASFPNPAALDLPDTDKDLRNFGKGRCGGGGSSITLAAAFRVSCNTTFAQIGMRIGQQRLAEMARRFGLERAPDFDLPVAASCIEAAPGGGCDEVLLSKPSTAYSSIGQFSVRVTPLQMAIVAAAVQNGGRVPRPYVVKEVQSFSGLTIQEFEPELSAPIYSKATAATMRKLMIDTVNFGTGRVVRLPGVEMGGKTGTAQTGVEGQPPHSWFVAFGPNIAVAVVVENGGDLGNEATGGKVAGPIARAIVAEMAGRLK